MGQSHVEAKSLGSQVLDKWLLMTVLMLKVMGSIFLPFVSKAFQLIGETHPDYRE